MINKKKYKIFTIIILFSGSMTLPSCLVWNADKKLTLSSIVKQKVDLPSSLTSVNVSNNVITIKGSGFAAATVVSLKKGGIETPLTIDSKSDTQIVASAISNLALVINSSFDLIIGTAEAQATYAITFTLDNNSIDLVKLKNTGASSGYVIKYNGTSWVAAPQNETQIFQGTWNAATNLPDLAIPSSTPGDYYIVSSAGTYDTVAYAVGDWIISDGYSWQKVPVANTSVTSFQGRKGIVTLAPGDYVSLKDTGTNKVTGSKLSDIADINVSTAPTNGQVLKWNTGSSSWLPADDTGGAAGIALTDLSATAPLSYSNTTGVFSLSATNILALPLTGLASGSGAIAATDTIVGAFGKLMSVPSDYVSKASANTISGATVVSGLGASLSVPTPLITDYGFAANVQYVNDQIAVNGNWSKGVSSSINYTAGNVGIGTTGPGLKLHVLDNTAGDLIRFENTNSGGSADIQFKTDTQSYYMGVGGSTSGVSLANKWWVNGPNSGKILMDSNGNVGIGTTTPTEKLHVESGNIRNNGTFRTGAAGEPGRWRFYDSSGYLMSFWTPGTDFDDWGMYWDTTNNKLVWKGSGVDRSSIDLDDGSAYFQGNVGIGISSPAGTLDVEGGTATSTGVPGSPIKLIAQNGLSGSSGTTTGGSITIQAGNAGSGGSTGGNITLKAGTGSGGWPTGQILLNGQTQEISISRSNTDNYVSSSASNSAPNTSLSINNGYNANGNASIIRFESNNATSITHRSYIGLVSATDATNNYGGALVFGQRTGVNSYAERMRIDPNGNVGIGTTAPVSSLDVNGTITAPNINTAGTLNLQSFGGTVAAFRNTGITMSQSLALTKATSGNSFVLTTSSITATDATNTGTIYGLKVDTAGVIGGSNITATFNGGYVGIGTTAPGYKLDVQGGDINASGNVRAAGVALTSDRRWKRNITPLKNSIEKLKRINGVSYDWAIDEYPEKQFSNQRQVGVIAQDVQLVFPELVLTDKDGFLSVNYPALIAPLIEAFKAQQQQIAANVRMFKTMQGEMQEIKLMVAENKREIASNKAEIEIKLKSEIALKDQEIAKLKERLNKIEKLLMKNK